MKSFESWDEKSILKPHAEFSLLSSLQQECSRLFQAASPAIHLIIEPACACCDLSIALEPFKRSNKGQSKIDSVLLLY